MTPPTGQFIAADGGVVLLLKQPYDFMGRDMIAPDNETNSFITIQFFGKFHIIRHHLHQLFYCKVKAKQKDRCDNKWDIHTRFTDFVCLSFVC